MGGKTKHIKQKIKNKQESDANFRLSEEAFYDYHRKRSRVYAVNFVRGIFFGFGTILGGTILVAALVWLLSQFVGIPVVGDALKDIINTIQNSK